MKIVLALSLLISSAAFAVMRPRGTFQPSICSENKEEQLSFCFGQKVSVEGNFVSIYDYTTRTTAVYEVVDAQPGNGGFNPAYRLEVLTLSNGKETITAERRWNINVRNSEVLTLFLNDGRQVTFEKFHIVYNLM